MNKPIFNWLFLIISSFTMLAGCSSSNPNTTTVSKQPKATIVFPPQHHPTPIGTNYVSDNGAFFSSSQINKIDSVLRNFEKSNLIPIKITITNDPSITSQQLESYNLTLLKNWSALHANSNQCMSIIISKHLGKTRIDYGSFVGRLLSSNEVDQIIATSFEPYIINNQCVEGISSGVEALMNTIRKNIRF